MSSDNQSYSDLSKAAAAITSQLMIAALVFLFMVVIFTFFLYIYAKNYMGPRTRHRRNTVHFVISPSLLPRRGLEADILVSLPTRPFKAADFDGGLECSVCLSEASEGEEVRILPKCGHGFHVGCIDMWFHSNTTCPLCRVAVEAPVGSAADSRTSMAGGMLVVDIPARGVEGLGSKSFRSLLSRGKAGVGSSCSPRGGDDIEHGGGGEGSSRSPKTATC